MTVVGRPLTAAEQRLVEGMLRASGRLDLKPGTQSLVRQMDDGGMGSLMFAPSRAERRVSRQLAEARFADADGTLVTAVLNLDDAGALFELDVWKVDFSPLQRLPEDGDLVEFRST